MTDTTPALLPCPFCGSEAVLGETEDWRGELYPAIQCQGDACWAEVSARTEDAATIAWNTRPALSTRPSSALGEEPFAWTEGVSWYKPAHRAVMASVKLGAWMSAALDDPKVCDAMKADIREWFSAGEPMEILCQALSRPSDAPAPAGVEARLHCAGCKDHGPYAPEPQCFGIYVAQSPAPAPSADFAAGVEAAVLSDIAEMMGEFVENWPEPKRLDTALKLIAKTMRAALDPPKHTYWGAGEPDCPADIKAGNGELHTLRCKVCGNEDARDTRCHAIPTPAPVTWDDKSAATHLAHELGLSAEEFSDGAADTMVEAFARHRIAHTPAPAPSTDFAAGVEAARPPFSFKRYVNGVEMADGICIEKESTLDRAINRAVALCPARHGVTVLVLDAIPTPAAAPTGDEAWQPIDTAPRDGTIIILTTGSHTGTGRWRQVASQDTLNDYDDGCGMRAQFKPIYGWHSVSDKSLNKTPPTHWMPLPASPVTSAALSAIRPPASGTLREALEKIAHSPYMAGRASEQAKALLAALTKGG